MRFTATAITATLGFASSAVAAPLTARQDTLQDWQVSRVLATTPSGRPGSEPWAYIWANVTDPNEITLTGPRGNYTVPAGSQGLNCVARWYTGGDSPVGRTWPCDSVSDGYWLMTVLEGTDNYISENFSLRFTHVAVGPYMDSAYRKSFEAEGHFEVGQNLRGLCGGSGACSWSLKEENNPTEITPSQV
ncbi:cell death in tomato 1 [Stemphylium lycopersici]|uniref:Cell death in tomato 1 n=1 Tax=Stemphylium lycopersici TaxID=183478 RepID=A0A364NAX7_STELY|nr:cell death in tomato 1 [Stemphylium lycopersici]RAR14416.1 cell death in tomato 1 [Stemphylium lycopersici]